MTARAATILFTAMLCLTAIGCAQQASVGTAANAIERDECQLRGRAARVVCRYLKQTITFDARGGQPRGSGGDPESWLRPFAADSPPAGHACSDTDAPGYDPLTGRVPGCSCYGNAGVPNPRGLRGGCYSGLDEIGFFFRTFVPILDSFGTGFVVAPSSPDGRGVTMRRIDVQTVGAAALDLFPSAHVGVTFPVPVAGTFEVNEDEQLIEWFDFFHIPDWEDPSGILLPRSP
jgi:limonene-1,2-epoxide hydrolase